MLILSCFTASCDVTVEIQLTEGRDQLVRFLKTNLAIFVSERNTIL